MKRILPIIILFGLLASPLPAGDTVPVTILYTAANKGYFLPYKVYESPVFKKIGLEIGGRYGGYAAIAHLINETRKETTEKDGVFLLLDGGNSLLGSSEANFFKGKVSIDFMNRMGYDAVTIANLDWTLGTDTVRKLAEEATFPFLNANMLEEETERHPSFLHPYTVIKTAGLKIGVIGYAQHRLATWLDPARVKGLKAWPALPILRVYLRNLRKLGIDLIIALDHTAQSNYRKSALSTEGIDVLIDGAAGWTGYYVGDYKLPHPEKIKNTAVFPEVDSHFAVGRIDLTLDRKSGKIIDADSRRYFMNLNEVEEDPKIKKFVRKYADIYFEVLGKKLQEVIGYAAGDLTTDWDPEWNSSLGTLVCQAMRRYAGTDIGIQNLGAIRRHIKKGPIKRRDVKDALPFENRLVTFTVKGKNLFRFYLLHTYHGSDPPVPWIYTSGMTITRTPSMKVTDITVGGEKIRDELDYSFATNSYIYEAGYLTRKNICDNIHVHVAKIADIVTDYIKEHSPVSPSGREVGTYIE